MKAVVKEIYHNILNYLEHYGFRMYKGKIWKYDPYIGYVIGIEVELTRWGTLNDVHVCASTYQSPIDENYTVKHEPLLKTWLHPCSYVREHEGISIYTMGHPNQSVDVTLKQQGEVLLPYLEKYFFPLLQFDETPEVFLKNLETMQIIECEARNGVLGVIRPELAMEYYRYGDIENALRIIDLNIIFCEAKIEEYKAAPMNLSIEERHRMASKWEQNKIKVIDLANKFKHNPEVVNNMIEENRAISEKCCQKFFTSRFFNIKPGQT